jgi:hypothetical protein
MDAPALQTSFVYAVLAARLCRDGSATYHIFDPCAVRLTVEEGVGHRRSLRLQLVPRTDLPESERV